MDDDDDDDIVVITPVAAGVTGVVMAFYKVRLGSQSSDAWEHEGWTPTYTNKMATVTKEFGVL